MRNVQLVEARERHMAMSIEIRAESVFGRRSAVPDATPAMGENAQKGAHLLCKRMVLTVAGAVKSPDFAR